MTIDTYKLENGYQAYLIEFLPNEYYADIVMDGKIIYRSFKNFENPFDAIFILMDLGLIEQDYPNPKFEPLEFTGSIEQYKRLKAKFDL